MERTAIGKWDYVRARFDPKWPDALRPAAVAFIGGEGIFQAGWICDDGPHAGDWAMTTPMSWPFAWLPFGDLSDVSLISDEEGQAAMLSSIGLLPNGRNKRHA
jgi:hypothetical protein